MIFINYFHFLENVHGSHCWINFINNNSSSYVFEISQPNINIHAKLVKNKLFP